MRIVTLAAIAAFSLSLAACSQEAQDEAAVATNAAGDAIATTVNDVADIATNSADTATNSVNDAAQ
jgi:hypothetical protein